MYLIEKHIINKNHAFYKECDNLCFQSKNVYNQALYNVRQYYFENKKYLSFESNYHVIKKQECYNYLPTRTSIQILRLVDKNFKSFFKLLKNPKVKCKIPKYLDKVDGRFLAVYVKQSLSLKEFKKTGKLHLSKTNIFINTKIKDFNSIALVRIVPRINHYVLEVVYKALEKPYKSSNVKASIDLGLNNLVALTYNDALLTPLIINGRPLKSINQYYNKKKSYYQSKLKHNKHTSKRINKLTFKRNNKVNDYLHKASRALVNQLVSNNVSTLVIGKNTSMKQDINLGRINNQNFTMLPLFKFASMIEYKCKLQGIEVIFHEESYTSKCSFFDNEDVKKHETYMGKRIKRGLFKTSTGRIINADVNGSYNIMKKAVPNAFANGIEGFAVNPLVLTIKR